MHPVIYLVCLLIFAASVPWLPLPLAALAGLILAVLVLMYPMAREAAWRGLRRVRWLLLSLAVLYLGFTPGEALLPQLGAFSPSVVGFELASQRGLVIVVMLLAATLYLQLAGRERVIAGLYGLLKPLGGEYAGRMAARFLLVLESLPLIEAEVQAARSQRSTEKSGLMDAAVKLVAAAETAAGLTDGSFELPAQQPVPLWQWMLLLGLLVLGIMAIMQ